MITKVQLNLTPEELRLTIQEFKPYIHTVMAFGVYLSNASSGEGLDIGNCYKEAGKFISRLLSETQPVAEVKISPDLPVQEEIEFDE